MMAQDAMAAPLMAPNMTLNMRVTIWSLALTLPTHLSMALKQISTARDWKRISPNKIKSGMGVMVNVATDS